MMNNRQHSYTEALLILLIPTMMLHISSLPISSDVYCSYLSGLMFPCSGRFVPGFPRNA
jgi:hypothetical protein